MKRLFIILAMFALLMTGAIAELAYTNRFFSEAITQINVLEKSMIENSDSLNNPETLGALSAVEEHWEKGEKFILMVTHHTIIRNACERVVALAECVRQNQLADAMVNLKQSRHYVEDLQKDNSIHLTNFF